ncbi:MAG: DMT family transporter [Rubrivivax sp.]|jgi:drug/metabolite transporter (DMT)-like permease|nr:DMT family transporter [Betaproteobacteria bacterium]MBK7518282.1 DMT family transporter [Betaproteobacteria bacterium]MBL0297099.1 DMT family transporter [Betaproteobacteria bacterium]MBP6462344.1 DMT family transporter [Rubrivivax sp.]MBP9907969.1 DMT family transporter [Rubrivivax sp.]
MRGRDLADLLLLAALWGASFLFMRVSAAEFGPLALAFVRVAGASMLLLPLLWWRGQGAALPRHWRALLVVGLVNSALPFALYALAALVLSTGLMSIFNATSPLWGALIAWIWLHDRPTAARALGLAIGFAGVAWLSVGRADLRPDASGVSPAWGIAACVAATALYGFGANYTRKAAAGVPPLAVAAGSQLAAAMLLAAPAVAAWPATPPGARAWAAAALLALLCTGLAYILYFRLISRVGPARAISVTFLIPAFAALWGFVVLGEVPTVEMLAGCAVILLGTALAAGALRLPQRA